MEWRSKKIIVSDKCGKDIVFVPQYNKGKDVIYVSQKISDISELQLPIMYTFEQFKRVYNNNNMYLKINYNISHDTGIIVISNSFISAGDPQDSSSKNFFTNLQEAQNHVCSYKGDNCCCVEAIVARGVNSSAWNYTFDLICLEYDMANASCWLFFISLLESKLADVVVQATFFFVLSYLTFAAYKYVWYGKTPNIINHFMFTWFIQLWEGFFSWLPIQWLIE